MKTGPTSFAPCLQQQPGFHTQQRLTQTLIQRLVQDFSKSRHYGTVLVPEPGVRLRTTGPNSIDMAWIGDSRTGSTKDCTMEELGHEQKYDSPAAPGNLLARVLERAEVEENGEHGEKAFLSEGRQCKDGGGWQMNRNFGALCVCRGGDDADEHRRVRERACTKLGMGKGDCPETFAHGSGWRAV